MLGYNGAILRYNTKWLGNSIIPPAPDPYNPLHLPPYTLRIRTDGNPPDESRGYTTFVTATLVPGTSDIYDVTGEPGTSMRRLLAYSENVLEVLGANTAGITNMQEMFAGCSELIGSVVFDTTLVTNMEGMFHECVKLVTVPHFDTHNVTSFFQTFCDCELVESFPDFDTSSATNMWQMFCECYSLKRCPNINTHNVQNFDSMFWMCRNLEVVPQLDMTSATNVYAMFIYCYKAASGQLAMYNRMAEKSVLSPLSQHRYCFTSCGRDSTTGSAELAQIPEGWREPGEYS